MNLTEFLLARIAEGDAAARALRDALRNAGPVPAYHDHVARAHRRQWPTFWRAFDRYPDPDRVLAECESKRWLVKFAQGKADRYNNGPTHSVFASNREHAYSELMLLNVVLAALALPYTDHPDFDPAWRVA